MRLERLPLPAPVDPLALAPARVHEAQGMGRHAFAVFQAMRHAGPWMWILPDHMPEVPMLRGLPPGLGERLYVVRPRSETDLLWSAEEALRAAPLGLVITEPEKPLSLTAGRRLQLAAEAGRTTGLILIRDGAGSNAAETRWACAPAPASKSDSTPHHWSLIKNKKGTTGFWTVNWNGASSAFHLVPEAGERHQPEEPPC